jgi:hypothetical protein
MHTVNKTNLATQDFCASRLAKRVAVEPFRQQLSKFSYFATEGNSIQQV